MCSQHAQMKELAAVNPGGSESHRCLSLTHIQCQACLGPKPMIAFYHVYRLVRDVSLTPSHLHKYYNGDVSSRLDSFWEIGFLDFIFEELRWSGSTMPRSGGHEKSRHVP